MKMLRTKVILLSALSAAAVHAKDIDFRAAYSAYGEAPSADIRPFAEEFVSVTLKNLELEADSVEQAIDKIREALQRADYPYGLSLVMRNPAERNYKTAIKIPKATRSLGETINLLCVQADLVWDFSSLKLTLRPNKAEQAGAGQPATRSESDSEGGDRPQPESEGRSR